MKLCVARRATAGDAPALESLYRELVADPLICVVPGPSRRWPGPLRDEG
jgi:hypothetical protein